MGAFFLVHVLRTCDRSPSLRQLSTPPRLVRCDGVYDFCMQFIERALGWGVVVYAVMYLLWSGMAIHSLTTGYVSLAVRLAALVLVTTIAARALRATSRMDVAPYSICWALVAAALDAVIHVPFTGYTLYFEWSVWAGYALVAIVPLLTYWNFKAIPRPARSEAAYRPRV